MMLTKINNRMLRRAPRNKSLPSARARRTIKRFVDGSGIIWKLFPVDRAVPTNHDGAWALFARMDDGRLVRVEWLGTFTDAAAGIRERAVARAAAWHATLPAEYLLGVTSRETMMCSGRVGRRCRARE